ncbi:MAG TPA: hypothetical protein VMX13_00125 [Sedimentisphaerales bacterium]|nr:hypothetical protein [Sedimentisphaerales bacterium]
MKQNMLVYGERLQLPVVLIHVYPAPWIVRANRSKSIETLIMELKLIQILIRCVSAAICLLMLFNTCGAGVLCIGEDGHIAIATADISCCGHSLAEIHTGYAAAFVEDSSPVTDNCGSCVDIPLPGGFSGSVNIAKRACVSLSVSTAVSATPGAGPQISELNWAVKSFEITPFFSPLRSVILLT